MSSISFYGALFFEFFITSVYVGAVNKHRTHVRLMNNYKIRNTFQTLFKHCLKKVFKTYFVRDYILNGSTLKTTTVSIREVPL